LDLKLDEIQSIDPKVIIEHKLNEAIKTTKLVNLVVEDTSLFCEGLNGLPGPLVKWFSNRLGNEQLSEIIIRSGNNKAKAQVTIGFLDTFKEMHFFDGIIYGKIVNPRGDNGFGWDPIFVPDGSDNTFAEMEVDKKNKISMRQIAFKKLNDLFSNINK